MSTVYAAMSDALLVAGGDEHWRVSHRLEGSHLRCVAATDDVVCVGTFETGLQRSTDGGTSWDRVGTAALPAAVMALHVSPHDDEEWWVGTEPSRVFRSTDTGETWTEVPGVTELPSADDWYFPPRPHTHHVRWIEVDPHDPDRLYVGIEAGAFVWSADGGETWHERPPGARRDNHQLATHPDAPGRVYAAAGDGYAESTDGAEHWAEKHEGLAHQYVWSVAPTPADPERVLVSSASGAHAAHAQPAESFLYRRTDSDHSWTRLDDRGIPTGEGVIRAVLAPGVGDLELFALNNQGLFRTLDAGDSWTRLPIGWPERFESQAARGLAVV